MRVLSGIYVFLAGVVVHWLWSTYFSVFGLAPDVLLILTAAVAAREGAVPGQWMGFGWGLALDVLSGHVFGGHALGLTLVGYVIGSLRRQMDVSSAPSGAVVVGVLTPATAIFYALIGLVFERRFLWPGWGSFLGDPFYNMLVCPIGFAFVRRSMKL